MTEEVVDLRIYTSLAGVYCPRCRIGLRDTPTGQQCWKCLGKVGIGAPPNGLTRSGVPCPTCSALMEFAAKDLVCPDCFHVRFDAGILAPKSTPPQCHGCGAIMEFSGGDFVCLWCGETMGCFG